MSAFKRKANGLYKSKNANFAVSGLNHLGKVKFLGEIDVELSQYINKGYLTEQTFVLHKSIPNSLLTIDILIAPYVKDQKIKDYLPKELSNIEEIKFHDQDKNTFNRKDQDKETNLTRFQELVLDVQDLGELRIVTEASNKDMETEKRESDF